MNEILNLNERDTLNSAFSLFSSGGPPPPDGVHEQQAMSWSGFGGGFFLAVGCRYIWAINIRRVVTTHVWLSNRGANATLRSVIVLFRGN